MATNNPFRLKKPCGNCPFRNDEKAIDLAPGRIEQIAHDITDGEGKTFFCHKTLSGITDNETDDYERGQSDAICAGSLIFQLKHGRIPIGARLGFMSKDYDYDKLMAQADSIIEPEDVL